ncbi:MAG: creatininase family protein [Anaerolineae bacterium]|nr:creatininase family protein [Anaerolineae bacterium]
MQPVYLADLPAHLLQATINAKPLALLPVGTIEWHATHLPVGLDSYLSIRVCEELSAASGCLIAPPLWYGISRNLCTENGFAGTISSIRESTMEAMVADICTGLASLGFKAVLCLSGHYEPQHYAAIGRGLATVEGLYARLLSEADLIEGRIEAGDSPEETWPYAGDHAAEFETSLMLHHYPHMVNMADAPEMVELPGADALPPYIRRRFPRRATAAYGAALNDAIREEGLALIARMLQAAGSSHHERT